MARFSSVILVDAAGRMLLQERDEHPVIDPEKWSLVGGHIEDGEDPEVAAYRELAEETGVVLPAGALTLWCEMERPIGSFWIWAARVDLADADIVVGEGRQIVFVDPGRAFDLDLSDFARPVVTDFLASTLYQELVTS